MNVRWMENAALAHPLKFGKSCQHSVVHSRPSILIVVLPTALTVHPHPLVVNATRADSPLPSHSISQLVNPIDCIADMADVATPPAAQKATANGSAPQGKQQIVKPDKPDEEKYKEELAKLEKEHAAAQEKLVSRSSIDGPSGTCITCRYKGLTTGTDHR